MKRIWGAKMRAENKRMMWNEAKLLAKNKSSRIGTVFQQILN